MIRVQPVAGVGLAPITDLLQVYNLNAGRGAAKEFLDGTPDEYPERYEAASPIRLLPLGVKQLIIHGIRDTALPVDLSRKYVNAARASGDQVDYVELPEGDHMEYLNPHSAAHAGFCEWLRSQEPC